MYTEYHPRWLRRRVSTYWWLERPTYFLFIVREISSVFVAWSVVYLLLLVRAVGQGEAPYAQFIAWSARPLVLTLNILTLFLVAFHAVTWFNLAPQALVVYAGRTRVPGGLVAAANYAAWLVVSAGIAWILLAA